MSTWSGKSLGNVKIGALIARGGMAEVYHGTHTRLNRNVAVKIMRDHVEEDPESRARFDREARVVAGLDHPNIIQIFDYDLVDGRPCIVMELVSGETLGNYLKALQKRGETLPHETIARLLTSIASAVDHAHRQNIVHRDIKPANILLRSKSGQVKAGEALPDDAEPVLSDFGLVRLLDSATQTSTGTVSGTPSYMSPEQARGDRVDRKTDIYSLGVVLYELLAGSVPFDAESSFGVLMKHLNEPPPPIPGISPGLQAVINRALAKDPAHRFDSAGELAEEFNAVLQGRKVSDKTGKVSQLVTASAANRPKAAYPRLPVFLGGALILAVIALLGTRLVRPPAAPSPDPNQPVGRITFLDFNDAMDKALISVNGLPVPEEGMHYEAWLLSKGGENRRSIGVIAFEGESGVLNYLNPDGVNLLSKFDQLEVTLEPDDDPQANEPNGDVVASSVFPPLALNHVRHLLVAISSAPKGIALIQGLWSAADSIDTSVQELDAAFDDGDEDTLRLMTEEIINQLAGDKNADLYRDWNGDGEIADPVEGYGLLKNGEPGPGSEQGYLAQTLMHAQLAADSPDAAKNIVETKEQLAACIGHMTGLSEQMLALAIRLQKMPFDSGMESSIAEMQLLASQLLYGQDANGNGRIEPIPDECGADTVYETAYRMAEMPLLPGADRVPPPVNSKNP